MRRRDQEGGTTPEQEAARFSAASILGGVRRLGWFLVGAAGATGALVAAPELYGRLRAALGGGDVWNELEPEPEAEQWGVLREAPPLASDPEPEPAADELEPVAAAEPEPAPDTEPEAVAEAEPEAEAAPEPEATAPEPDPEPEAPAEPDAYETSVWSQPARAAEPPAEEAATGEAEPAAAPVDDEPDDDTAEIPSTPLTAAPPPEDTAATDLRSRIEASRARLHRKAQAGGAGDDEPASEPDEPDEPDSSA
jgi:hypothetical protein